MDANTKLSDDELMHYGVKGMRWGVRRARKENKKIDRSFKKWNENAKQREDAIGLGKQANKSRMEYERDSKNKDLKKKYKADQKAYNKSLRGNTTYRKGQVRSEVGKDMSRKYLSESKMIKKQLDKDPNNKQLQKQYKYLSDQHQYERAKARRAPEVAAKRSARKASIKRGMTMSAKRIATGAAITAGAMAVNKVLQSKGVEINGKAVSIGETNIRDAARFIKNGMEFMKYFY